MKGILSMEVHVPLFTFVFSHKYFNRCSKTQILMMTLFEI